MIPQLSTRFFIVYVKPPIEYPCDTYDHDSALHFGATMDYMVVISDLILLFFSGLWFSSFPALVLFSLFSFHGIVWLSVMLLLYEPH